jgi:uncharacterized protein (DUF58 family)
VVAVPLYFLRREQDASRALREARLQGLTAQRQEIEGRLRSLRAQIEPHFLFNTLAHIQRLHEVDPGRGAAMLRCCAASWITWARRCHRCAILPRRSSGSWR